MLKLLGLTLFTFTCFLSQSEGLEIDEKLTMRIIKTSETRKTILINRGFEDGLVQGDHAKFFLSVGVVARGVMIKGAPTRSVWSIYRLVNADYIRDDQVMNLKIAPPVKVTKDESRTLVKDDTPAILSGDPRDLGIELAPGADDMTEEERAMVKNREMRLLQSNVTTNIENRFREVFATFFFGQFDATTTPSKNGVAQTGTESATAISAGYEHYFQDKAQWFSRISLVAQLQIMRSSVLSHQGENAAEATNEYGVGVNLYPLNRPQLAGEFIYYGNASFMMGSTTSTIQATNSVPAGSLTGSTMSYSFGAGIKYYAAKGYGARMQLDYITRDDKFIADSTNTTWTKSKSGPRVSMGFSYHF